MSLPIDTAAIAAQTKAEHEYGERLMDLATARAIELGHDSVRLEDVSYCHDTLLTTWPPDWLEMEISNGRNKLRCICAEKFGTA